MAADFTASPGGDSSTVIAGYPKFYKGFDEKSLFMYYSQTGFGDDGPVTLVNPFDSNPNTNTLHGGIFTTIDGTNGDSGSGLWHPAPDYSWTVYGVFIDGSKVYNNLNLATQITAQRLALLKDAMSKDEDDASY